MAEVTVPEVDAYLTGLYEDGDPVRLEMEELARRRRFPIVGLQVGTLLSQLARIIGARRVFELGSGYGYSALFLARAVGPRGLVHCTDRSAENADLAEQYLTRAGLWGRVSFQVGDGCLILEGDGGEWDLIFNDVDKEAYPATIELAARRLRPGGLFITDNVLWHGRVLPGTRDGGRSAEAVREFTATLLAHPAFVTTILPVRDGVAVALKTRDVRGETSPARPVMS
jgi:caffeoyl-CoA O-methyltransferase